MKNYYLINVTSQEKENDKIIYHCTYFNGEEKLLVSFLGYKNENQNINTIVESN